MSIQVKELAFVFHVVTDVAKARQFYEGLLGLKVGFQLEFTPGQWWIEYDVAGQAVAISNAMPGTPGKSLVLEVADLDAARTAVTAAGAVVTQEIMDFTPCRVFYIADPDGNEIGLHQRKPRS
ncbi:MAG: VOC family protein [Opitutus sp.]